VYMWRRIMTKAELLAIEEGICIMCGGDDVECLEDCIVHKCVDCGHTVTITNKEFGEKQND